MTTTPIAGLIPGLVPGQTGPSTGQQSGSSGSTGDAFLALVQGMLDGAAAQPPVDQPPAGSVPCGLEGITNLLDTAGRPAAEDAELTAPVVEVTATPLPDLTAAAALVVPVFAPAPAPALPTPQVQAEAEATSSGTPAAPAPMAVVAPVAAAATAATTAPVATAATAATAATTATATATAANTAAPAARETSTPAPSVDAPAPATGSTPGVELPDVAVQRLEHRPATSEQAAAPAPAPAPAPASAPATAPSVAPVSGVAPVATATAVAPAPADTHRVSQQVFPEVVKVVSNPNGPQRVTIKLNPEALGEVRVVLTSRRGGLEVSLAAGSDARAALTEGAPELQRLLEAVGRGDSRIVVRDLLGSLAGTTVSQPAAAPTSSGVPTDPAGGAGTGTGRPGGDATSGQQSRNHSTGDTPATDGTQGTTNPSQPTESVTRAHPGLDVTM